MKTFNVVTYESEYSINYLQVKTNSKEHALYIAHKRGYIHAWQVFEVTEDREYSNHEILTKNL